MASITASTGQLPDGAHHFWRASRGAGGRVICSPQEFSLLKSATPRRLHVNDVVICILVWAACLWRLQFADGPFTEVIRGS